MGKPSLPRGHARKALAVLLLATTALSLAPGAPATAQQAAIGSFAIPPGDLNTALAAFGRQSGLQVSYPSAIAAGRTSPGFSGQAGAETALSRILQGTGLDHRFVASDMVVISAAGPDQIAATAPGTTMLDTITIYGDRAAATLGQSRNSVAIVQEEDLASPVNQTIKSAFNRMANVSGGDYADSGFSIRGVSSEGFSLSGAPLASLYIDGVEQTRHAVRRGARGLFDTEQIEVYRGPQSTLSGRAAMAGAIYLRTKDPDFERSGAAQLTYGSDNLRQAGLAFGDALGDSLAYRVSAEWSKKDSDLNYDAYRNYPLYKDLVTDEYYTLRGKLLWHPAGDDATRVLISYAHSYDRPNDDLIAGPNWSPFAPGVTFADRRADLYSAELSPYGVAIPAWTEVRDNKVDSLGVEITHELSDSLRLTALTGLTRSKLTRPGINTGDESDPYQANGRLVQKVFSQELRLNHDSDGLRWVAGIYAAREKDRNEVVSFPHPLLGRGVSRPTQSLTSLALFGEAAVELWPGLTGIAGGRVEHISRDFVFYAERDGVVTADGRSDYSDTIFLPKVGLQYEFENGQAVALVYQHGYRPGGSGLKQSDGLQYSYDAETARNIELSWRGTALEDRLSFAANLFYMSWRDQQVTMTTVPGDLLSRVTGNAARSRSWGGEVELSYAATDRLDLYGSIGLLKTRFVDFNDDQWGNFSGLPFPGAPERSIALGFRWGDDLGWFGAASAKHVSSSLSRLEPGAGTPPTLKPRTTVDAEIGYGWDRAKVTAYATNLFDKEYFVYEAGPGSLAALGKRREVGLRLDYRF